MVNVADNVVATRFIASDLSPVRPAKFLHHLNHRGDAIDHVRFSACSPRSSFCHRVSVKPYVPSRATGSSPIHCGSCPYACLHQRTSPAGDILICFIVYDQGFSQMLKRAYLDCESAVLVVCGLGKSRLNSSIYPEQLKHKSPLFDGFQTRQNPEPTNYRYAGGRGAKN